MLKQVFSMFKGNAYNVVCFASAAGIFCVSVYAGTEGQPLRGAANTINKIANAGLEALKLTN